MYLFCHYECTIRNENNTQEKLRANEAWLEKKENMKETLLPFCVGLAMFLAGGYYYFRSEQGYIFKKIHVRVGEGGPKRQIKGKKQKREYLLLMAKNFG